MTPAIEVKNLRFRYPDGKDALRGVSFKIQEGERVGLIGPNGAGKSTVLLHLNGILPDPHTDASAISVFGEPITALNLEAVHRTVGLLFQNPDDQLFCATVYEDVAFGPRQFGMSELDVRTVVQEALKRVGLEGLDKRSPHHLSGGEKRRVCLAGVLACQPRVLVLDEPTSDLDPRGKRELTAFLSSVSATMIIATHDLELVADLCSRVIVLDNGELITDGPSLEVLADQQLMLRHGLEKPHSLLHRHPH